MPETAEEKIASIIKSLNDLNLYTPGITVRIDANVLTIKITHNPKQNFHYEDVIATLDCKGHFHGYRNIVVFYDQILAYDAKNPLSFDFHRVDSEGNEVHSSDIAAPAPIGPTFTEGNHTCTESELELATTDSTDCDEANLIGNELLYKIDI